MQPIFSDPSVKEVQKKKTWTKSVWSIISNTDSLNNILFEPFNDDFRPGWEVDKWDFNVETFEKQKEAINFNLWTIIKYHFMKGELNLYSPFNPEWVDDRDEGFLIYPLSAELYGENKGGSYETDAKFKTFMKEGFLGRTDYEAPLVAIHSRMNPGKDSLNDKGEILYYNREYSWFGEKDIIRYKVKEEWEIDELGNVLNKSITSIAPGLYYKDQNGKIIYEFDLFWIDYEQLSVYLKKYYALIIMDNKEKVISYDKYFSDRPYAAEIIRQDTTFVKAKEKKK